jgi:hypothetical protein
MKVTQANRARLLRPATSQLFPEAHDHPGANPQNVLSVVETMRQSGDEVLGLQGPNRDLPGHF